MVKGAAWLSVTPEPERELPVAVATLELGHAASPPAVAREQERIERLILRGPQRAWLAYLHHAVELIELRASSEEAAVVRARSVAHTVIANHHNLLLALPGPGWRLTAADRATLDGLRPDSAPNELDSEELDPDATDPPQNDSRTPRKGQR